MAEKEQNKDIVRFNLHLPREVFDKLKELQEMTGKSSLAETVRAALKVYHQIQESQDAGKHLVLVDKHGEKERLLVT